jgi:Spy/CpxP family protein refolding chaperone
VERSELKMKTGKIAIGIAAITAIMAISAVAFAHGGYGRHRGGCGERTLGPCRGGGYMTERGYGYGRMTDGGPGYGRCLQGCGRWQDLSDEETAKIEEERNKFFDATRELRRSIEEKQSAIRSEMLEDNPDRQKLFTLQGELSGLNAEFDQKALTHRLEMRKLLPEQFKGKKLGQRDGAGRGCWR